MRWPTTAVLTVLLVGLATFYYVYEIRQGPDREKAAAVRDRLWKDLEAKDVEEIVLKRGAETVRLRRAKEGWGLEQPVTARAEARPADDLAGSLATLRVEREIDANPAKPADFGLAPPAVEVTFKAKGQERGVRLGGKNPTGTWIYAQEAGKPAVFLAAESLLRDAQKGVTELRDKTVIAFERKDVRGVEVRGPGGQVVVAAVRKDRDKDEWQLTGPLAAPADREQVGGLLDKIRQAKAKEFVTDAPGRPADYGLDRPTRLQLSIGEEKDRAVMTLLFGRALPDKKGVYVQRDGQPTVMVVDEEVARAVPASAAALRDKTVFSHDRAKIERLELESTRGTVALATDGGGWRITAPASLRADESAVSELLGKLRDLRARDFLAEDQARLAAYGLDRPAVRLRVWEKEAKDPRVLLLAPARDPKDKDRAYAAVTGPGALPAIVSVDAKALTDLARTVTDLRDHSLASPFDTREVTRVAIERPGQTLVLERGKGEDDWQLVAPRKGSARGTRVSDVVWMVRNLRWKELVAEQGWDPGRYGLEAPTTVALTAKDGKAVAALAIGRAEGAQTYVRVPGQPALYLVETRNLGDIPGTPEDLLR